jgi:hypothetical protein
MRPTFAQALRYFIWLAGTFAAITIFTEIGGNDPPLVWAKLLGIVLAFLVFVVSGWLGDTIYKALSKPEEVEADAVRARRQRD